MQNKKVLFITHRYPKGENTILEKDTVRALFNKGYQITVVAPTERRNLEETHIYNDNGVEVLYVKTGNNFNKTLKIEKFFTILTRPYLIKKAIKKYYSNEEFDIIFGYTPFMANYKLFSSFKKQYNAKIILFLWDIFPQNGKDLGMFKNKVIFKYLKFREKMMYKNFDKIICNCEGQIDYILKNNFKEKKDLFVIRNSEFLDETYKADKNCVKRELGYQENDILSIFGGNMGEPQELENLLLMIESLKENKNLKFIFLGDGTQKEKLKHLKKIKNLKNLEILDFVERNQYEKILSSSDIGLISLNKNYTVPNFPAKITGYTKQGIPIFASLDRCSLKYLGKFIEEKKIGKAVEAGNLKEMRENFLQLVQNIKKYKKENLKKVYLENFDANKLTELIEKGMGD